jgi:hypothetical protein
MEPDQGAVVRFFNQIVGLWLAVVSSHAFAYGELQSLPGAQILAAGDIQQVTCPIGGKYDCLSWPHNLYELTGENVCFTTSASCGYSCEGFITQKNQVQTLYVLGSFPKLSSASIQLFKCPSKF